MAVDATIDVWATVAEGFGQRLGQVSGELWAARTPCPDWTVRDLVEHVLKAQRGYAGLLGYDLSAAVDWPEVRDGMAHALETDDAFDTSVEHPVLGVIPKAQALGIVTNDLLVHTWDLARAIGGDERLDPGAVAACYEVVAAAPQESVRGPKVWGELIEVGPDADLQTRLLAMVGRRA
jgi:uncharacterized protein (TIGR03086 family)